MEFEESMNLSPNYNIMDIGLNENNIWVAGFDHFNNNTVLQIFSFKKEEINGSIKVFLKEDSIWTQDAFLMKNLFNDYQFSNFTSKVILNLLLMLNSIFYLF